jgi:hypothetical protein
LTRLDRQASQSARTPTASSAATRLTGSFSLAPLTGSFSLSRLTGGLARCAVSRRWAAARCVGGSRASTPQKSRPSRIRMRRATRRSLSSASSPKSMPQSTCALTHHTYEPPIAPCAHRSHIRTSHCTLRSRITYTNLPLHLALTHHMRTSHCTLRSRITCEPPIAPCAHASHIRTSHCTMRSRITHIPTATSATSQACSVITHCTQCCRRGTLKVMYRWRGGVA